MILITMNEYDAAVYSVKYYSLLNMLNIQQQRGTYVCRKNVYKQLCSSCKNVNNSLNI